MDWKEVRKQAMEERPGKASLLGTASIMGLHMVTGPAVGACLGWLADSWLESFPWGSAAGLFLGLAAGIRNVWVDARWLAKAEAIPAEAKPPKESRPSGTTKDQDGLNPMHGSQRTNPARPCPRKKIEADATESLQLPASYGPASILAGTDIADPSAHPGRPS